MFLLWRAYLVPGIFCVWFSFGMLWVLHYVLCFSFRCKICSWSNLEEEIHWGSQFKRTQLWQGSKPGVAYCCSGGSTVSRDRNYLLLWPRELAHSSAVEEVGDSCKPESPLLSHQLLQLSPSKGSRTTSNSTGCFKHESLTRTFMPRSLQH